MRWGMPPQDAFNSQWYVIYAKEINEKGNNFIWGETERLSLEIG